MKEEREGRWGRGREKRRRRGGKDREREKEKEREAAVMENKSHILPQTPSGLPLWTDISG